MRVAKTSEAAAIVATFRKNLPALKLFPGRDNEFNKRFLVCLPVERVETLRIGHFLLEDQLMDARKYKVSCRPNLWTDPLISLTYKFARVLLKELPPNQAEEIFICDPLISLQLVNLSIKSKDILHYFAHIKSTSQFVVLPFVENSHWSLSIINLQKRTAILMNSLPGIHGQVKLATKRLILALGAKYSEWRGDEEFRLLNQPVPTQQDATSCGWHVIANAWKYILCKYKNYDINAFGTSETYVWSVRAQAIKKILDHAITPDDPDSPPPELSEITKKKGMPKRSPVKHFAFKQKEKEKEKGSPQKSRGPKIIFVSKTKGKEKRKEDEKVENKQKDV